MPRCNLCKFQREPCHACRRNNLPQGPPPKDIPAPKLQYAYPNSYDLKQHKSKGKGRPMTYKKTQTKSQVRTCGKRGRPKGSKGKFTKAVKCPNSRGKKCVKVKKGGGIGKTFRKVAKTVGTVGKVAKAVTDVAKAVPVVGSLVRPVASMVGNVMKGNIGEAAIAAAPLLVGAGMKPKNPFPDKEDIISAPRGRSGKQYHYDSKVFVHPGIKYAKLSKNKKRGRNTFLNTSAAPEQNSIWNAEQIPVDQSKLLLSAQSQGINTLAGNLNLSRLHPYNPQKPGGAMMTAGSMLTAGSMMTAAGLPPFKRRKLKGGCACKGNCNCGK